MEYYGKRLQAIIGNLELPLGRRSILDNYWPDCLGRAVAQQDARDNSYLQTSSYELSLTCHSRLTRLVPEYVAFRRRCPLAGEGLLSRSPGSSCRYACQLCS